MQTNATYGPIGRLGRYTATHFRAVLIAWLLIAVVLGFFVPRVETALSGAGWETTGSQSVQARHLIDRNFRGLSSYALMAVISSPTKTVSDPPFRGVIASVERRLRADGEGNWREHEGESLSELAGCLDIDISATPFTNTLAVRRLDLQAGENAGLSVAHIKIPDLTLRPVSQRYTCNWRAPTGALVTYEGLFRGFKADLALDADGLVMDYPETFRRLAPR